MAFLLLAVFTLLAVNRLDARIIYATNFAVAKSAGTNSSSSMVKDVGMKLLRDMSSQISRLEIHVDKLRYQNDLIHKLLRRSLKCPARSVKLRNLPVGRMLRHNSQQSPQLLCPDEFSWNRVARSCQRIVTKRVTWRTARERCLASGADLISITTRSQQRYVMNKARNDPDARHCNFWIGASDQTWGGGTEAQSSPSSSPIEDHILQWHWVASGNTLSYTNWQLGEPNNGGGGRKRGNHARAGGGEHCVQMMWVFLWQWNDAHCDHKRACYICETRSTE